MAAVTVTKRSDHVVGDLRMLAFRVNVAATGDTLQTSMRTIVDVSSPSQGTDLTGVTITPNAAGNSLALATSGPLTGLRVNITGR